MWRTPCSPVVLLDNEVHVWRAALDVSDRQLDTYRRSLSVEEHQRMRRLRTRSDQQHFVASRGILRALLGHYAHIAPANIAFSYSTYGKPSLQSSDGIAALTFNLSHANGQAIYAVSSGRAVGVDIEYVRHSFDYESLASSFFASQERAALWRLPEQQRLAEFFRLWVCKEAYVKAHGLGFALPLDQFAIILPDNGTAEVPHIYDENDADRWSLCELPAAGGYAAALAVEGADWHLRCWDYDALREQGPGWVMERPTRSP
jgi:4'-phosphopantetheinyl transferase